MFCSLNAVKGIFLLSFHNLCANKHVKKVTFEKTLLLKEAPHVLHLEDKMFKLKFNNTKWKSYSWTSLFVGKLNYGASFIRIPFSLFPPQHFYLFEVLFPNIYAHILGILLMNSCNTDILFSNYYHLQSVRFEYI